MLFENNLSKIHINLKICHLVKLSEINKKKLFQNRKKEILSIIFVINMFFISVRHKYKNLVVIVINY